MKISYTTLIAAVLLTAASSVAAQSANRSGAGAPAAPSRIAALAPERAAITRCRAHCDALTGSGAQATAPRQSGAERQARQSHCARRMT